MRNLKLMLLLFGLCTLMTTQNTFAQENSKSAKEKSLLSKQRNNEVLEVANKMTQEIRDLKKKYETATPEQRIAINEEIKALKLSYDKEVKGLSGDHANLTDVEAKKSLEKEGMHFDKNHSIENNEEFIVSAKKRIKNAKIKIANAEKNGELSEEEVKMKKNKILQIEKKLNHHAALVNNGKDKVDEQKREIRALQK